MLPSTPFPSAPPENKMLVLNVSMQPVPLTVPAGDQLRVVDESVKPPALQVVTLRDP